MNALSRAQNVRLACLMEATARKPGNVHRFADFADAGFLDFAVSTVMVDAPASAQQAGGLGLGVGGLVLHTLRGLGHVVTHNTYLGTVLLLAPLVLVPAGTKLREGLARVLDDLTVDDARLVYQAIRLANPAALGRVAEQDIADVPTVTLRDAMRLAAPRDLVSRQYANDYDEVFSLALPALAGRLQRGQSLEAAIVGAHLALMAAFPDSLIARKCGLEVAQEASKRAAAVLDSGWPDGPNAARLLSSLDAWLRDDLHRRNPGTTADLVTAALYAALYDGVITLPRHWRADFAIDAPGFAPP